MKDLYFSEIHLVIARADIYNKDTKADRKT